MPTFETFGEWMKYHRLAAKYSQFALAKKMGCSHSYIQYLEKDLRPPHEKKPLKPAIVESMVALTGADLAQGQMLAGLPLTTGIKDETERPFFSPKTIQIAQAYETAPIYVRRAVEALLKKD